MCVNNIDVSESEIIYAENILLGNGLRFDNDRRDYIKNFETADLRAVPGSGKTTLLLAKLLILEKKLPLKNNQAVLVLSHTNTAVNEIKNRIEIYCPQLFTYPNFIGTIQSFVDEFLAIPYFESKLHKKIISIDENLYYKSIEEFFANTKNSSLKKWLENKYDPILFLHNLRFDKSFNLISNINECSEKFELKNKESSSYKGLKDMKLKLLCRGILHYDDAYSLAFRYIHERPAIINILNKRFKYVFVDEMQDMDMHQFKLLEILFDQTDVNGSIYQRLGDNNQAIYFSSCKGDNVWNIRDTIITINGSNRLTPMNASLISKFSLDGIDVVGLNQRYSIKPILYVFENDKCKCKVIQKFAGDLTKIYNNGEILILKVIAWRKKSDDEYKKSLYSYCPQIFNTINEIKYVGLYDDYKKRDYSKAYNIIIDYIVSTINMNGVLLDKEKVTKARFLQYIRNNESEYPQFRLHLYLWCTKLIRDDLAVMVMDEINSFIQEFCKKYHIGNIVYSYLTDSKHENNIRDTAECRKCKVYENFINVCTVHSVKGETHDATLFLESFYDGKYESDILADALNGKKVQEIINDKSREIQRLNDEISKLDGKRGSKTKQTRILKIVKEIDKIKEYTKLVYVGLSRAKGVVAYGISKDKFDHYKKDGIESLWDIRKIE